MAYTAIFAATTSAVTGATGNFTMTGATKVKVDGLAGYENVILQEEDAAGTTYSNVLSGGAPIVFTKDRPSMILYGIGSYRLIKGETAAAVGAGYETA